MLNVLKVLGRIFLISIGLLFIAGGGLCVVIGSSSQEVSGVAMIGLVSLLLGVAGVWWILRRWIGESRGQQGGGDAS
jgi:hypothetical protein